MLAGFIAVQYRLDRENIAAILLNNTSARADNLRASAAAVIAAGKTDLLAHAVVATRRRPIFFLLPMPTPLYDA